MLTSQILKSFAFQSLDKVLGRSIRLSDSFPFSFSQCRQNLSTDCQNVPRGSNQKGSKSGQAFFFPFFPQALGFAFGFHRSLSIWSYTPSNQTTRYTNNSCLLDMIDLSIIIVKFISQRVHNYTERW